MVSPYTVMAPASRLPSPTCPKSHRPTLTPERLYIDPQEPIRFRVDRIEWQAVKPTPNIPLSQMQDGDAEAEQKDPIEKAGYKIFVTIAESGLGVTSWWEDAGDEMELEQEQE